MAKHGGPSKRRPPASHISSRPAASALYGFDVDSGLSYERPLSFVLPGASLLSLTKHAPMKLSREGKDSLTERFVFVHGFFFLSLTPQNTNPLFRIIDRTISRVQIVT